MNTYLITLKGYGLSQPGISCIGKTRAAARYNAFLNDAAELYESFNDFLQSIDSMRLLHKFKVSDLFTQDITGMQRTLAYRGIDFANLGMRVEINGRPGTICGTNDACNLSVCFDGDTFVTNCHPHYMVKYLDRDGNVVFDTTKKEDTQ